MFKDHNDRLFIASSSTIFDISQFLGFSESFEMEDKLEAYFNDSGVFDPLYCRTYWPVICSITSGMQRTDDGMFDINDSKVFASIPSGKHIYFMLSTIGSSNDAADKFLKVVPDNVLNTNETIKMIDVGSRVVGRQFYYAIHFNCGANIEKLSFSGSFQNRVDSLFDPNDSSYAVKNNALIQDQIFWMSRSNPLKSNSNRAKPIVEVEIV
jgi:hypothetical protein